jgi:hypothetical protein
MKRYRIIITALTLMGLIGFWPGHAQSKQYFDATMRFTPRSGTQWHYFTTVHLTGFEIARAKRNIVGGIIRTIYDDNINSSGNGLVGVTETYNLYEALDLSSAPDFENPTGGPAAPPNYNTPTPDDNEPKTIPNWPFGDGSEETKAPENLQSVGGGGGGDEGGGGAGGSSPDDTLVGEGQFDLTPIMESEINFTMSESGRMLDIEGMELIGDIIDPSRSITVRQVFQTSHFLVLPDYSVHLNETWKAPVSWTIPFVGETMEIPITYRLADLKTTYRFRVAAIDFNGILQFDVDVSDEGKRADPDTGELRSMRKESNIKGDIIIQGRAYVDLDRGVVVAVCDTPALGREYFIEGSRRGGEARFNDLGQPWPLNPGFWAQLHFERRDLYTPLGNVIDKRQEIEHKIQELQWFTTTVVE